MALKHSVISKPFGAAASPRVSLVAPRPTISSVRRLGPVASSTPEKEQAKHELAGATLFGAAGLLTPLLLDVENAMAQKGEYGIVEGRIASMTHPVLMFFLFGASVYTGWLGLQWRCAP